MDTTGSATGGTLDEALTRLHTSGPERLGRLTNHAPMAAESLAAHGHDRFVHRWLDRYAHRLEDFPARHEPVTAANWRAALGEPRRAADWIDYFTRELSEGSGRPWQDVLTEWWPRLLPGLYGGSTHPVIRVGHAVRTLLGQGENGPRRTELAHGLGYWAAVHHPMPGLTTAANATATGQPHTAPAAALDAVRPIPDRRGGFPDRLAQVHSLPSWHPAAPEADRAPDPDTARARLAELVRAATHRYATHGHGEETMLVHAATAPNAVLRTLPALPRVLWVPSLRAAWSAAAAVTAMYLPDEPVPFTAPGTRTPEEVFEQALAHGDEHVIKFADTALDIGDEQALAAALRAVELSTPLP